VQGITTRGEERTPRVADAGRRERDATAIALYPEGNSRRGDQKNGGGTVSPFYIVAHDN